MSSLPLYKKEINIIDKFFVIGCLIVIKSSNFLLLFLGLEIQSFCIFIFLTLNTTNIYSTESGIKYYFYGGLASFSFILSI
tara:strand:+ start:156 stop:398 length:243 start_codon:yes stop_codon:yes gene_type:complete